jgi:hypothetical protein
MASISSVITGGLKFTPSLLITDGYGTGAAIPPPAPPVVTRRGGWAPLSKKRKKKVKEVIDYWPSYPSVPREWDKPPVVVATHEPEPIATGTPNLRPVTIAPALVRSLAPRSTFVLGQMDWSRIVKTELLRRDIETQRAERQRQRDDEDELMMLIGIIER